MTVEDFAKQVYSILEFLKPYKSIVKKRITILPLSTETDLDQEKNKSSDDAQEIVTTKGKI
jgi:hypothetical protein